MALHFISDLHLEPGRPQITERFVAYLEGPARQAEALYILGDLFEVWAGDDVSPPLYDREIAAMGALADTGVPVHFLCGNRDFLCGREFARAAGLALLREPHEPVAGVWIMHGDLLCNDDVAYQRFRRFVRQAWLQWLYGKLPGALKLRITRAIRGGTQRATRLKPEDIFDVNPGAVADFFAAHPGCRLLIHGHTHRPADHALGDGRYRLVLSDWTEERGEYLSLEEGRWERHTL